MGILHICLCFLFPFLCRTLPSKVNERERELTHLDEERRLVSVGDLSHGDQVKDTTLDFPGSGCGSNLGTRWDNVETHGFLREYETGFLDKIRQKQWEDLALFGLCPEEAQDASMGAMKELSRFIAEPEGKQLVVLHLQKGVPDPLHHGHQRCPMDLFIVNGVRQAPLLSMMKRIQYCFSVSKQDRKMETFNVDGEIGTNFQFQGTVRQHITPLLQHLHLLIGVFYPDTHNLTTGSKVMISGEAVPQSQIVCLSSETRYLVIRLSGKVMSSEPEDLRLNTSFQVKEYSDGSILSSTEAAWHLFGMDKRCFTKITPVIFMVLSHSVPIITSDHTFSEPSLHNQITNPKKDEFLETLSHFSTLLMTSHTKPSSTIHVSLDPNDENAGDLRPQLLNVTEVEALEWLVDSQEPLVFLFLPGSKHLLANRIQERLNGTLLERIKEKTQEVLEDMKDIFSTGDHIQILHKLLKSCHSHYNVSYLSTDEEPSPPLGDKQHRNLHSLILLKTLQTIHAYWQDRKKLSRQNRGAGLKHHCRLQELTINLKPYAEYKDIHFPEEININNCVGPCRFPQTTQSNYQAHVILLIQLQERRQSGLERPPCCVPVQYQEQWLMVAQKNDIRLHRYPNMVAKECGCR